MRATPLFVLAILVSLAAGTPTQATPAQTTALRTFIIRGDISGGRANTQYFGTFEIAAERPSRFIQTEMRAYFGEGGARVRHNTAMGFDGPRVIYQPDVPDFPTKPEVGSATPEDERRIRAAAEDALRLIEAPLLKGARAPFTITRGAETWKVRDVQINVALPANLFRPR